jgi:MSHA biogenesis protein MshG
VPLFEYRARNGQGLVVENRLEAASASAVAAQLLEAGITPVRIAEVAPRSDPLEPLRRLLGGGRVDLEDLITFSRQMYTLVRAGVPILRSIGRLAETAHSRVLGEALRQVGEDLRGGHDLSAAMQKHPRVFSRLFVAVVQVGENTGRLEESFRQIGEYLELERETRRRISSATRYPMLVLIAIAGAMVLINLFVIPAFSKTFESLGAELPWATKLLIGSSNFFVDWWPWLLAAGVAGAAGLRRWLETDDGRLLWSRWKLRMPIVGSILLRATLARYARSFAMTASAGLPLIQALGIVARAVDNDWVGERIRAMRTAIERGEPMTHAATHCGLFTPLVLDMMSVGEESGTLDEMHREIALAYEAEVDYELRRLSELLEPLLIAGIGGIVLILALGIYMPMWDMATAVKNQ